VKGTDAGGDAETKPVPVQETHIRNHKIKKSGSGQGSLTGILIQDMIGHNQITTIIETHRAQGSLLLHLCTQAGPE